MFLLKKKPPTAEQIEKARNTPPEDFMFKDADLCKNLEKYEKYIIKVIHITCLPGDPKLPHKGKQTLHWRMTLRIHCPDNDEVYKYVLVDQVQDEEYQKKWHIPDRDFPVHMMFAFKGYPHSRSAVEKLDVPVVKRVTFFHFLNLIKRKGLDRFRRCPDGHGCLSWLKTSFRFVRMEDWLDAKISEEVQKKLDNYKQDEIVGKYIIPGCPGHFI